MGTTLETYKVLSQLNVLLSRVTFPLILSHVEEGEQTRDELVDHIHDYLMPRLLEMDAPMLAVVGGSTGAGKSTIVNSLLGENVSQTSILRPTTMAPVLICHPQDKDWFLSNKILPEFGRTIFADGKPAGTPIDQNPTDKTDPANPNHSGPNQPGVNTPGANPPETNSTGANHPGTNSTGTNQTDQDPEQTPEHINTTGKDGRTLHVVITKKVPPGFGIIDSPDIDSVREANHALASQIFGAADLWIFVTTAARYADFIPWQYLQKASQRNTSMVVLLNRIPRGETEIVTEDCRTLFAKKQLNVPIYPVEETHLQKGRIGRPLSSFVRWLQSRIVKKENRKRLIVETMTGALKALPEAVVPITRAMNQQHAAKSSYETIARSHLTTALKSIHHDIDSGLALRNEVVEQFANTVGTSQMMGTLQHKVGRFRDTLWHMIKRKPMPTYTKDTQTEIESALTSTIVVALEVAIENTAQSWGQKMRDKLPFKPEKRQETKEMVQEMVANWRDDVMRTIETEAESKVASARVLTTGTNIAGVALMLLLFSTTGGLTGGEVVITGGTAVLSHGLLEAIFGEQALRSMTNKVRSNLYTKLDMLIDVQHERMCAQLQDVPTIEEQKEIEWCTNEIATSANQLFSPKKQGKQGSQHRKPVTFGGALSGVMGAVSSAVQGSMEFATTAGQEQHEETLSPHFEPDIKQAVPSDFGSSLGAAAPADYQGYDYTNYPSATFSGRRVIKSGAHSTGHSAQTMHYQAPNTSPEDLIQEAAMTSVPGYDSPVESPSPHPTTSPREASKAAFLDGQNAPESSAPYDVPEV